MQGNHSCCLVSIHFLCDILSSHPVFPYLMRGNVDVSKKHSLVLLLHRVYGHLGGKRRAVRPPGTERIARRLYGCENQPADAARKISLQRISVNIPPKDVTSTDKQHEMKCACLRDLWGDRRCPIDRRSLYFSLLHAHGHRTERKTLSRSWNGRLMVEEAKEASERGKYSWRATMHPSDSEAPSFQVQQPEIYLHGRRLP